LTLPQGGKAAGLAVRAVAPEVAAVVMKAVVDPAVRLGEAAAPAQAAAFAAVAGMEVRMEARKSTRLHRRATPEPTKILRLMPRQRTNQPSTSDRRMRAAQMQS
jgi:hypothetical protein